MSQSNMEQGLSLPTAETVTPTKESSKKAPPQPSPVTAMLNSLGISREMLVARADDVRKLLAADPLPKPAQTEHLTPSRPRAVNNTSPTRRSATESLFTPPSASPMSKRASAVSDFSTPKTPSKTRKYDAMEAIIEKKNRESAGRSGRKSHHRTNTFVPLSPSAGRNRVTRSSTAAAAAFNQTKTVPSSSTSNIQPLNSTPPSSLDTLVTQPPLSKYYRAHTLVDKFSTPPVEMAPPPPVKIKKKPGPKPKQRIEKTTSMEKVVPTTTRDKTPVAPAPLPAPILALPELSSEPTLGTSTLVPQLVPSSQPQTDVLPIPSQTPVPFPQAFPVFIPMPHGVPNLTQEQINAYFLQLAALMQNQQAPVQLSNQQALMPTSSQGSSTGPTTPQYTKEDSPLPPSSPPPSSPLSSPPCNPVALPAEPKKPGPPYTLPPGPYSPSKPSASYAAIIGRAILASPGHRLTLQEIYDYITTVYPYFKRGETTWMNSIRHVLSTTKAFHKVIRDRKQGKTQWAIMDEDLPCFEGGGYKKPGSGSSRKRKRDSADEMESPDPPSNPKKPKKGAIKSEARLPALSQLSQEPTVPALVHPYPSPQRAAGHGPPIQPYYDQLLPFLSPSRLGQVSSDDNDSDSDVLAQELEDALSSTDFLPTLDTAELLPPSSDLDFGPYTSSEFSDAASIFDLDALTQQDTPRRRSSSTPPTSLPPSATGFDLEEELKRSSASEDELPMLSPSYLLKPPEQWGQASPSRPKSVVIHKIVLDEDDEDEDDDEPLDLHSLSASQRKADKGKQKALDSYPISPSVARRLGQRAPQTPPRQIKTLPESPLFTDPTSPTLAKLPGDDASPLAKRKQETDNQELPSTPPGKQSLLPVSSLRTPLKNGSPDLGTSPSSKQLLFGMEDSTRGQDTFESLFSFPEVPSTPSGRRLSLSLATSTSRPPVTPKRTVPPPVTPKRSSSASKNNSLLTLSGGSGFSGTPSRYLRSYTSKNGSMSSPFRTPGSSSFSFSHLLDDVPSYGLSTSPGFGSMFSPPKTKLLFDSPTGISAAFGKSLSPSYGKTAFNLLDTDAERLPSLSNEGW